MKYDILFTASTYKSAQNAIRFANSIEHIDGNNLCIITGSLKEDINEISKETDAITFISDVNSLYLSRAWGFVWAINNDIEFKYLCSCDDDLEFIERSDDIVAFLHKASEYGFSVLAFQSPYHAYSGTELDSGYYLNAPWLNGDCMYSQIEDNIKFGLPDCFLHTPVMYYSEVEYQQRMQVMTGRPIVVPQEKNKYIHHFRTDPVISALRSKLFHEGSKAGTEIWEKKHGFAMKEWKLDIIPKAYAAVEKSKNIEHIMFGGQTNNWQEIYDSLSGSFHG